MFTLTADRLSIIHTTCTRIKIDKASICNCILSILSDKGTSNLSILSYNMTVTRIKTVEAFVFVFDVNVSKFVLVMVFGRQSRSRTFSGKKENSYWEPLLHSYVSYKYLVVFSAISDQIDT